LHLRLWNILLPNKFIFLLILLLLLIVLSLYLLILIILLLNFLYFLCIVFARRNRILLLRKHIIWAIRLGDGKLLFINRWLIDQIWVVIIRTFILILQIIYSIYVVCLILNMRSSERIHKGIILNSITTGL
jgi:hypothetical protein